jgi:DNA-binding transcriptional LysR family regulator
MDTKLLDYFIACYELGSINKAAHALYISPQGMGKALDKLEAEVQNTLFIRNRSGLQPTACGRYFYERSKDLISMLQSIEVEMKRIHDNENIFHIGLSCGVTNVLPTRLLWPENKALGAGSTAEFSEDFNDEIKALLLAGQLDLALIIGDMNSPLITQRKIFSRKMKAIVYDGHPLSSRSVLQIKDLKSQPLITLNEKFSSYHLLIQRCRESGFLPDIRSTTMESTVIYSLCADRQGIGIDVDIHRRFTMPDDLRYIEIEDSIPWTINAVYRTAHQKADQLEQLIEHVRLQTLRFHEAV